MGGPISMVRSAKVSSSIAPGLDLAQFGSAFFESIISADTGSTCLPSTGRRGGGIMISTDGTDNDEAQFVFKGGKAFGVFAAGQKGSLSFLIKTTEGNTDDQDWFVGLADVLGTADFITDSDAFAAAVDGIGFYKVKDSLFFRTAALNASVNSAVGLSTTACASATEYDCRLEWECLTGGMTIRFYVDNTLIDTVTGFSYTSLNAMYLGLVLKNGGANAETFTIGRLVVSNIG